MAAALASGSTTRPPLPQPWASTLPLLVGSGPSPFEATRQPAPPKASPRLRIGALTLTRYTAFAAVAQAAYLVGSPLITPPTDGGAHHGQGPGRIAWWGELLGLRALPLEPRQLGGACWDAMAWPLALVLALAVQAGVYSSAAYHRAAAARSWRLAAAAMAPRVHSRRGLRRAAEEWAETLAPWTSYAVLVVVVLLPPIGMVGVVTLALLLSLLYVHQSFVLPESRARLQRPIWLLLAVLMAAALVVTWAFSVPSIHRALVAPHGLLGPACDGPAPPNGSGTFCANVLYDLGLADQAWLGSGLGSG